ncbi:MAG: hypothetical protein NC402_04975, partial [Prevotella sp.]|nr:hypothetical protein [Prevotella sp.]
METRAISPNGQLDNSEILRISKEWLQKEHPEYQSAKFFVPELHTNFYGTHTNPCVKNFMFRED